MDRPDMSRLEAVMETVHPDDAAEFRETLSRCLATGERFAMRYRLRRADGVYRWMSSGAEPIRDQGGRIIQWYGLCHDIDDQMRADEALRQSESRLRHLIDAVPAMIWSTTPHGAPTYLNKRYIDVVGATLEDLTAPDGSPAPLAVCHPDDQDAAARVRARAFETGRPYVVRYRQIRCDGSYRWTETRAEALRDESGTILQWYGVGVDIDDMVTAQEALRDRERELSHIVNMVPVHIRRLTPQGEPIFFNKRLTDFLGTSLADLDRPGMSRLAASIDTLVHPDEAVTLLETVRHSLATGEGYSMKYRIRRADGVYRWMEGRAEPVRDEGGAIVQWYAISIDIDDEVRGQEALRLSEHRLRQLVDAVPVHFWTATPAGLPSYISKRYQKHLGIDLADFEPLDDPHNAQRLRQTIFQKTHPDDAAENQQKLAQSFKTGEKHRARFRRLGKDGVYRWVEGRLEPQRDQDGNIIQWCGVSLDIDDQIRAEDAIRQSERRLQQMIDAVPVNILSFSAAGEPTYINKRYKDYLGITIPHFDSLQEQQRAIVHPDDFAEMYGTLKSCFQTGAPFLMRYRRCGKDGIYRWTEGRAEPLRNQDGAILQWYAVSLDIDDEMRAQEALRQSERSLRQLVETLPGMIYCATPKGEPTYRSRQLREYLGFDVGDRVAEGSRLIGTLDTVIHPDELVAVKENYARSLATGEPYLLRHRLRRFDGEYRWVETRAAAMRNAEGEIVQWNGICMDIEDQVRAQEKLSSAQETLARASQAASLAELSASIAHEVNQPLAAVVFNSHACQRWLSADPPNLDRAKITVERVIRDANAAADVVSRVRALFKQSVERREAATLSSAIAEAHNLMAEEATRRRVRVVSDVEDGLPLVVFDRVPVQQVLINLMRDGVDALTSAAGGRVLGMRVRRMDDVVQVEISDRGPGVEFPDKIFEPFFTTKEQGMGIGLAICRSIVESHGGRLWTEKNEPHGARFIFTLPFEAKTEA
jgi:PAS domain S-box-containing protein